MEIRASVGHMKIKMAGLTFTLCFFGAAVCLAQDPHMGTWKLNEAKSKFAPGVPKNHTVVYETAGDNVKITVDRQVRRERLSGYGRPDFRHAVVHEGW